MLQSGHTLWKNGERLPADRASVSVFDLGFVQGATIVERLRTFNRRPFLLDQHLDRLRLSLDQTGVADPKIVDVLPSVIDEVMAWNADSIPDWDDFAIVILVTPGKIREKPSSPTVCVQALPVTCPTWHHDAVHGVPLVIPSVRQMPADVIAPQVKHRSRLHWFVADQEARKHDSTTSALLLDRQGFVTETSTGNLIVRHGSGCLTPRHRNVLHGISVGFVGELLSVNGQTIIEADLTPTDVIAADEVFLSSSGYSLLPVTSLNGRRIGSGHVGQAYKTLIAQWSEFVDVDILEQFEQAAS